MAASTIVLHKQRLFLVVVKKSITQKLGDRHNEAGFIVISPIVTNNISLSQEHVLSGMYPTLRPTGIDRLSDNDSLM